MARPDPRSPSHADALVARDPLGIVPYDAAWPLAFRDCLREPPTSRARTPAERWVLELAGDMAYDGS